MRLLRNGIVLACAALGGPAFAAPPPEVSGLVFAADKTTLSWSAAAGADRYNVYRGTLRDGSDLTCLVLRTPDTQVTDPDAPGELFTYVVAAWNVDGEGSLGLGTDGTPRVATIPCADGDDDGVRDDLDNCPGVANPVQRDQDLDAEGDRCDPSTYDFEADVLGQRPAEMTQDGEAEPSFVVRDQAGDRAVRYDGGSEGVHDRFDRLPLWLPYQDQDVYLDTADLPGETLSIELWSAGTWTENAGGGLQFRIDATGDVAARVRRGREMTDLGSSVLASTDRLRLRLRKQPGTQTELHVDRWDGVGWQNDVAGYTVTDDHRLRGRALALVDHDAGRRPLLRLTADVLAPAADLAIAASFDGLADWKVFQRGPAGTAPIPLPFIYRATVAPRLEARVVETASGLPLPGFDFGDLGWSLPAAPGGRFDEVQIDDVPAGGNYDVEARLVDPGSGGILDQAAVVQIAVGDVFLAVGQSNMAGYSGGLGSPEPPVDEAHLFGNDYVWKQAAEPMDDGTDQVDRISEEFPAHSLMLRFAKDIATAIGVPVAVIPAPLGGTNLNTQWQRRVDDPTNRGTLYGSSVHRVLAQGYAHPIRGVLWYQGESDVGRGTAAYLVDLQALVANYRADLGNPGLFFGNCQLATAFTLDPNGWLAIQEAQRQQAEADALSAVIGLVDQPRSDFVHLSVDGYKEAGRRLAQAVLAGSYGQAVVLGPQIVDVRFATGGPSVVEIEYDKAISGGAPLLYFAEDQNGGISATTVSASANIVSVTLQRSAVGATTLSYGFGREPTDNWVTATDGSGAALTFADLPVN